MSFMELIDALRAYGVDVLLLALGVTLLVALLKKTVMKNVPKKVFVVLPFAIGIVLYAIFRALVSLSPEPFTSEIASTLEKGFACGCCSTLYYVIYEQFIRGRSVSPLYPLLEGVVPEKKRRQAANALYKGSKALPEEERVQYFKENLNTYSDPPMSEEELSNLASILAEFLSSIQKK